MKRLKRSFAGHRTVALLVTLAVLMLLPLGLSIASHVFGGGDGTDLPFVERPDVRYRACVKDTEYMRYHHWELLRDLRAATVRRGVRSDITLAGCRECHPDRGKFCNRCHGAVSLSPDCFGCHYYPVDPDLTVADRRHPGSEG